MKHTDKILFVCVEDAGRSQIAEAFERDLSYERWNRSCNNGQSSGR